PNERIIQRHRFYPFIVIAPLVSQEKLTELVLSFGFRGFNISEKNNLFYLQASSFSELKKISTSLALHINKKPLVLEPERAFLLEKGWSLFSSFERVGKLLFEANHFSFDLKIHSKDLGFFLTKEIPFSSALKINETDALFLVDQLAWSEVLNVSISQIPSSKEERTETFLENVFFKNGEMLSFESNQKIFSESDYDPIATDSTSKIDFSLVWAELFSNNFFNIGPETKNCSCCAPLVLDARNLLPSSLIKLQFVSDNIFFESSSTNFSIEFHNSHPFKEERLSKKKEFCLNSFPSGPFFKNDFALIPLVDATHLIDEGKAVLVSSKSVVQEGSSVGEAALSSFTSQQKPSSVHELNWFCLNKESFFSKEVRATNLRLFELRKRIDFFESNLFGEKNFDYYYSKAMHSALTSVLCELSSQLTNSNSKFFSTTLAKSIVSVQEATLSKFKEFSEKNGYRLLHAGRKFASIKGFSSLKLAKNFSEQTKLPQPQIASFKIVGKTSRKRFA
ncbi:MAG: hypothetical protein WCW13_06990, partial [archaeon]